MFLLTLAELATDVNWGNVAASIGSIGFACWYSYYTTTSMIPKMLADHKEERGEMQAEHKVQLAEMLKDHREERDQIQIRFNDSLREVVSEMKSSRENYLGRNTLRGGDPK